MIHRKSLKYINKLKQVAMDFIKGADEESPLEDSQSTGVPVTSKDEIDDIFAYKQGRHKLKRKKRSKRTKLKK